MRATAAAWGHWAHPGAPLRALPSAHWLPAPALIGGVRDGSSKGRRQGSAEAQVLAHARLVPRGHAGSWRAGLQLWAQGTGHHVLQARAQAPCLKAVQAAGKVRHLNVQGCSTQPAGHGSS